MCGPSHGVANRNKIGNISGHDPRTETEATRGLYERDDDVTTGILAPREGIQWPLRAFPVSPLGGNPRRHRGI